MSEFRVLDELGEEFGRVERRSLVPSAERSRSGVARSVIAIALAVLVAAAVPVVFLAAGPRHTGDAGAARRSVIPAGFTAADVSMVSPEQWWVIGSRVCLRVTCAGSVIVRTTDGGRHFVVVPEPRAMAKSLARPRFGMALTFANRRDGIAYAVDGAGFATHDGGTTWRRLRLGGGIEQVQAARGMLYGLVASPSGKNGSLMRSPVGSNRWTRLNTGPAGDIYQFGVYDSTVVVDSDQRQRNLLVSHDQGGSFSQRSDLGFDLPCSIQPVSDRVIWAFCRGPGLLRSPDAGRTFSAQPRTFHPGLPEPGQIGPMVTLAAISPSTALVQPATLPVYRTTDGGRSFRADVELPGGLLGDATFVNARYGVTIVNFGRDAGLYATTDAGRRFRRVKIR